MPALFAIIIIFLCHSTVSAATYSLSVQNGSGSGFYPENSSVHIYAHPYDDGDPNRANIEPLDPNAPLRIFDRWTGDSHILDDPYSADTSLTMPTGSVTVSAQYKDAPRWASPRMISHFPANHKGVIFIFHGMGGSASNFFNNVKKISFSSSALLRGYAIIALDSFDRSAKLWDYTTPPSENIDMQRVAALRNDLILQGKMTTDDPVYLLGVSGGGFFTSLFTQDAQDQLNFPVEASALYISAFRSSVDESSSGPTIFLLAENDTVIGEAFANDNAYENYNSLLTLGTPTQLWILKPSPVHPHQFWGIEELTQADSEIIWSTLQSYEFLDSNGYLIENPLDSNWQNFIPFEYQRFFHEISDLLNIAYAEHTFMNNFNQKVLDFFDSPTTNDLPAPEIFSFTPASAPPNTEVTINGNNFTGTTSVTFNDTAAAILSTSENSLLVSVPANATSGPIAVTNITGTAISAEDFVVIPAPEISSFTPTKGAPGTEVTINGAFLQGATSVTFGNGAAQFSIESDNRIMAIVPQDGSFFSKIKVTTEGGTVASSSFFRIR